jgi:hypothetical protein
MEAATGLSNGEEEEGAGPRDAILGPKPRCIAQVILQVRNHLTVINSCIFSCSHAPIPCRKEQMKPCRRTPMRRNMPS